jgi:HAMP domain-containing protein
MLAALLVQTTNLLPPLLLAALVAVVLVSLLALLVSLRIARRIRAIGDQGKSIADDESIVNPPPAETDR